MIDSYYEIGSSHMGCEDYSLHGTFEGMKYGIVADGCSTAEHSEIGAQILCHVARYYLTLHYHSGLFKECTINTLSSILGNSILKRADDLRKLYPITPSALQATLLIIVAIEEKVYTFVWGDGVIIEKHLLPTSREITKKYIVDTALKIDYSANAPFYLGTDKEAYENFLLTNKGITEPKKTVNSYGHDIGETKLRLIYQMEYPFHLPFTSIQPREDFISITIATDGILSYRDENKTPIDFLDIVPEVSVFKSKIGEFVKKRMTFFKRSAQKKQWTHYDDIATATIIMDEL